MINEAYEREQLIAKISTLMGVQFKRDNIGRVYAVINPNIKDGKYDPSQVFEFRAEGGIDTTEWVNKWLMERFTILNNFVTTENLFDVLQYEIKELGNSTYLVIIQPITLPPLLRSLKYLLFELLGLTVTAVTCWLLLK